MMKFKIPKFKKKESFQSNEPKEKKVLWKRILSIFLVIAIILVSLFLVFALYIVITSPNFEKTELYQTEPSVFYDKNGNEIARVGLEDSDVITYDEIPNVLIDALIATEDSRFFQHNGIDLFRFLKASVGNLLSKSAGGASTLSMQVIKNTYTQKGELESNKLQSIVRKFRDIYMAVFKLEANYTKEEIIEFYFNSQWFANSASINTSGTYGIERASQYYFGKSAKDVNLAEATMMVGMFQNPRLYNPYRNPEGCRNRQKKVLDYMIRHGYITREEKEAVLAIPIPSMLKDHEAGTLEVESSQAFIDYVINEILEDLGVNARQVSLKVYTTFDPNIQKYLEAVENGEPFKFPNDEVQEAIAVTSVEDGSVLALSGGRHYKAMGTNRAVSMNRQPGSTAKPLFDYAMYIENISHSTYSMLLDEKTTYSNGSSISNYDNGYKGLITMRFALKDSRNIPALRVFKAVYKKDPDLIKNFVHSVGIDYGSDLYEAAAIGGFNGVSPLELSAAYASFARGGYYIAPYGYTKVVNTTTGKEYTHSYTKKQVMKETTAFLINDILEDVYNGSGIAGKTGTTNLTKDDRKRWNLPSGTANDAWYVTYTTKYATALWYGYDKFTKESSENKWYINSSSGGAARKAIMNYLTKNIYKGNNESFPRPKGIKGVKVELETFPAQLCSSYTPDSMCISEYFVSGTEPTDESARYSKLANPTNGAGTFSGNLITLSWDAIKTPDAVNTSALKEHFDEYYYEHAASYLQKRLDYNNKNIGSLGYEIYLNDNYVGFTNSNSFVYNTAGSTVTDYTFTVKSAYSIFKSNRSSGITINVKATSNNSVENNTSETETETTTTENSDV